MHQTVLHVLFGRVVSCHFVHSLVPPQSVPLRQVALVIGFVEPLIE